MTRSTLGITLAALLLAGCADSERSAALADYQAAIEDARALVEAHTTAVDEAGSMDEVDALETQLASDWAGCAGELHDAMDEVQHCGMGDGGMMADADGKMGDLEAMIAAHVAAHGEHADMEACLEAEGDLRQDAGDECDGMMAHHDHWSNDGGHCMAGPMM